MLACMASFGSATRRPSGTRPQRAFEDCGDAQILWYVLIVAVLGLNVGIAAVAAELGTTSGIATFNAKGEVKNYKPDVVVWNGTFVGVSVTESRKGPLHNSAWDCTGEAVLQGGDSYLADGIQGYYTFACRQGGTICTITSGEYKIPLSAEHYAPTGAQASRPKQRFCRQA